MTAVAAPRVRRSPQRLLPDRSRVLARLFVPGHEGFDDQESRTGAVLHRLLDLDEPDVEQAYDAVIDRFGGRHRDLVGTFERHADVLHDRLRGLPPLSDHRRRLLGATFTSEYAIEGAALCNPSVVAHPDQAGVPTGGLRLAMSVRAIGEGHSSSVGFRSGFVDATGTVQLESPSSFVTTGAVVPAEHDAAPFRVELHRLRSGGEAADLVLDALGERFTANELEERLRALDGTLSAPKQFARTIGHIRAIAQRTYGVTFGDDVELSARVLFPVMPAEARGMEDARFVRFTEDDGDVTYYASYTAYDGTTIRQQLLATMDFRAFTSTPLVGPAADNKGLALFPRRIGGRYYALSRADRESNAVTSSENLHTWPKAQPCQRPTRSWELLQLGNCGSPIETEAGWLVLTHGVGPMRTYCIGAVLLDLDDPTQILGELPAPLLAPQRDEQDGYVPNVLYSCGGLVHAGTLVIPYGIGDAAIGVATVPIDDVLAALEPRPARR
jgi:predicted GH43/DUF377 family glycosyl hydrolase